MGFDDQHGDVWISDLFRGIYRHLENNNSDVRIGVFTYMKKIISFLLAGALFIITAAVLNANIEAKLEETADISGKI